MIKPKPPGSERLKSFVERIENIEEEQKAIGGDKRDLYTELKAAGYNPKAVRRIIQQRRAKPDAELQADIETYQHALGMAVEAASNGDMSLRKAAEKFGVSKSAVQRRVPRKENPATGTPHDPETGETANGGGDHDGGLLKQPMAEVARVAPPSMLSSAPVAASGTRFAEADIGEPAGYKVNNDGLLAHDSDPEPATHSERPALQEVGAPCARPEGTPLPRESRATEIDLTAEAERLGLTAVVRDLAAKHPDAPIDLTIPTFLDQRKRQAHA